MGRDYSDLGAILANIRPATRSRNPADWHEGQSLDAWRKRCWYARPAHADPELWLAAVQEVAALVGEPLPTLRDVQRPRSSPVVFE